MKHYWINNECEEVDEATLEPYQLQGLDPGLRFIPEKCVHTTQCLKATSKTKFEFVKGYVETELPEMVYIGEPFKFESCWMACYFCMGVKKEVPEEVEPIGLPEEEPVAETFGFE